MVEQSQQESSDGFSPEWLTLREPADHAARNVELTTRLADWASQSTGLQVLEMGTGTGSNLRYLCPQLGHGQHWTLLDNDQKLLDHLPGILQAWSSENEIDMSIGNASISLAGDRFDARIQWRCVDLANELDSLPFANTHLVTASALLDLTSDAWLQRLARLCLQHRCASLFVLNYDGTIRWQPAVEEDQLLMRLLNQHQLGDKGFGPAMGPEAGKRFAELLQAGQQVHTALSSWQIGTQQQALQTALMDGWLDAAIELDVDKSVDIRRWHDHHRQQVTEATSRLSVGHTDVLALPLTQHATTD